MGLPIEGLLMYRDMVLHTWSVESGVHVSSCNNFLVSGTDCFDFKVFT